MYLDKSNCFQLNCNQMSLLKRQRTLHKVAVRFFKVEGRFPAYNKHHG